jgi:hypothetical protein
LSRLLIIRLHQGSPDSSTSPTSSLTDYIQHNKPVAGRLPDQEILCF